MYAVAVNVPLSSISSITCVVRGTSLWTVPDSVAGKHCCTTGWPFPVTLRQTSNLMVSIIEGGSTSSNSNSRSFHSKLLLKGDKMFKPGRFSSSLLAVDVERMDGSRKEHRKTAVIDHVQVMFRDFIAAARMVLMRFLCHHVPYTLHNAWHNLPQNWKRL